jgi:hypothetical protein
VIEITLPLRFCERDVFLVENYTDNDAYRPRGNREPPALFFSCVVLLMGWGVRSIDAPENRNVVGLRGSSS